MSRPSVPGNNKTAGAATTSVPGKRNAGRQSHVLNSNGHKVREINLDAHNSGIGLYTANLFALSLLCPDPFFLLFQDHENNGEVAPPAPASQPASTKHQAHIEKSETVSKATGANTAQGVSKSSYVIIQSQDHQDASNIM